MIEEQQSRSGLYFGSKVVLGWLPRWLAACLAPLLTGAYHTGSNRTVQDVLESLFPANTGLRGLLAYHWGTSLSTRCVFSLVYQRHTEMHCHCVDTVF